MVFVIVRLGTLASPLRPVLCGLLLGAFGASTQEQEIVILEDESLGGQPRKVARALFHFVHLAADAAVEVVVMVFSGGFISWRFARETHLNDSVLGDECLERSIDRRHPHAAHAALRKIKDLSRGNRSVCFADDRLDRAPLPGVSFHPAHE